jgi:hypothetical protein
MKLTPRMIAMAARGGLGLCTAGAILAVATSDLGAPPPLLLAGCGWGASLLTMLAFPRVRRNDLLASVAACSAFTGFLTAAGPFEARALAALAGLSGPLSVGITMAMMRVRHLAASNWHMPFAEWQQLDRRRRGSDSPKPALTVKSVVIEAERNC